MFALAISPAYWLSSRHFACDIKPMVESRPYVSHSAQIPSVHVKLVDDTYPYILLYLCKSYAGYIHTYDSLLHANSCPANIISKLID